MTCVCVCVEVPKLKEFMLLKARKRGGLHLLLSWSCTPQVLWHRSHLPPFKGLRGVEAFFKVLTTLGSRDWKLEQKNQRSLSQQQLQKLILDLPLLLKRSSMLGCLKNRPRLVKLNLNSDIADRFNFRAV